MQIHLTDNLVLSQVLQGNQQAFAALVKKYHHFVFAICLRYTDNRQDAEELVQDSFVKAYKNLAQFRGDVKFSTWLHSIAHSLCITFARKRKIAYTPFETEAFTGTADDAATLQNKETVWNYKQRLLNYAIRLLGPVDAELINLFYKKELSLEEMGAALSMQANTVKVKLHRARTRLKDKIRIHCVAGLN